MKLRVATEKAEALGFIDIAGLNIEVEVAADESITFLKQILPIARELKSFRLFEVEKDNEGLAKTLNEAREEKRDLDRKLNQAQATSDFVVKEFNSQIKEKDDEIHELKEKLREARLSREAKAK